jgi:uncharacterized membrane protein
MGSNRVFASAAGIGVVAGLRSMTAPAVVSWSGPAPNSSLQFLKSKTSTKVLSALAAGELVLDKLPSTPNRTSPGPLIGRIASGAFCGAALCSAARRSVALGAALGGLGAIAGSFAGYHLRRQIHQRFHAPDTAIALAEDALAIEAGYAIASSASTRVSTRPATAS